MFDNGNFLNNLLNVITVQTLDFFNDNIVIFLAVDENLIASVCSKFLRIIFIVFIGLI